MFEYTYYLSSVGGMWYGTNGSFNMEKISEYDKYLQNILPLQIPSKTVSLRHQQQELVFFQPRCCLDSHYETFHLRAPLEYYQQSESKRIKVFLS